MAEDKNINESMDKVKELAKVINAAISKETEDKKHYTFFQIIAAISFILNSYSKRGLHEAENHKQK